MAEHTSIDIMGSLNDALSEIVGSKVDLSLPSSAPFAEQKKRMDASQALLDKFTDLKKAEAETQRQRADAIRRASGGGAGENIRAPSRIRDRI